MSSPKASSGFSAPSGVPFTGAGGAAIGSDARPEHAGRFIAASRHAHGITFTDQPKGFFGREASIIISFILILLLVTGMGIWKLVMATRDIHAYWPAVAIISIMLPLTGFGAILLLAEWINLGRLPTILWTEDDRLVLLRPGIRGMHRQEWLRRDVRSVEAVAQATGANLKTLGCLCIEVGDNKPHVVKVFEWRPMTEVAWVALTLRPFVGLDEPEAEPEPAKPPRLGDDEDLG